MKRQTIKYHSSKIVERGKIDIPNTKIHGHSLSWLGTDTTIKSGRGKLALWAQTSLSEMMRSYIENIEFQIVLSCYLILHISKLP
jgi:hypothetical protein